jgi:hypothetical protein
MRTFPLIVTFIEVCHRFGLSFGTDFADYAVLLDRINPAMRGAGIDFQDFVVFFPFLKKGKKRIRF